MENLKHVKVVMAAFRDVAKQPVALRARIGPQMRSRHGGAYSLVHTEWSYRDVERAESVVCSLSYSVFRDGATIVDTSPAGGPTEMHAELKRSVSPSGTLTAILRKIGGKGGAEEKQFLEIWNGNLKEKNIDLEALEQHGKFYDDGQFGVLAWSNSESHLLYVAEKKRPKGTTFFQSRPPSANTAQTDAPGDKFLFREDWGEALVNKSEPVLCILDVVSGTVSVLDGLPPHLSPGQALWAPADTGVLFVGWSSAPGRLGITYCTNRRSALYYIDLSGAQCVRLSEGQEDETCVWSPRLSPDQCRVVYLQNPAGGPHHQCSQLRVYDWYTKQTRVVVDIVAAPESADAFPGLYCAELPTRCWASDSQRVVLATAWRSRQELVVVDTEHGDVTPITAEGDQSAGCWKLLDIDAQDLMVAARSSPSCPPHLVAGFLPARSPDSPVLWASLDTTAAAAAPCDAAAVSCDHGLPPLLVPPPGLADVSWSVLRLTPPAEQRNKEFPELDYEAILVCPWKPGVEVTNKKVPLVVCPHGGPHSAFVAEWSLNTAALVKLGMGVLLVNYRGSSGFGQNSIRSLPGNVGMQDVQDMQHAVTTVLASGVGDPAHVFLVGGSHGGFLSAHLIGQFPGFYQACALRNPVINIASMVGATDIPDWCVVEAGLGEYSATQIPTAEMLAAMLKRSPIVHIAKVRTPALILLGEGDRRVPPQQGHELERALRARGIPVRLLSYPDNNHALSKVEAEADAFVNTALWFGVQHG